MVDGINRQRGVGVMNVKWKNFLMKIQAFSVILKNFQENWRPSIFRVLNGTGSVSLCKNSEKVIGNEMGQSNQGVFVLKSFKSYQGVFRSKNMSNQNVFIQVLSKNVFFPYISPIRECLNLENVSLGCVCTRPIMGVFMVENTHLDRTF